MSKWKEVKGKYFVNPYNFISLSERCTRITTSKKDEKVTGFIQCTLIPKTPIFIPNTSNDNVFNLNCEEHKSFDFYSYTDISKKNGKKADYKCKFQDPVIPGSSIRGVIRSAFEAVTNSCLSTVNENVILYKRIPAIELTGKPGLLIRGEKGNIELIETEKYMLKYRRSNKDTNFISKIPEQMSENLINELLEKKFEIKGRKISFLDNRRGKIELNGLIKNRFNKLDTVCYKNKNEYKFENLSYHCKMTKNERNALLCNIGERIKGEMEKKEFESIIEELYDKSQSFHNIDDLKDGEIVYVEVGNHYDNKDHMPKIVKNVFSKSHNFKNVREAMILKGEDFIRKHHISVFNCEKSDKKIEVSKDDIEYQLNKLLNIYQDSKINKKNTQNKTWYKEYSELFNRFKVEKIDILPVYFREIDGKFYFSPSCITKEVYYNKITDLIKDYSLCNNKDNLCEACRLFGNLNDDNVKVASKVRFTDATIKNKAKNKRDYYIKYKPVNGDDSLITLKELSSPKISATEFYIDCNNVSNFYTYDYYKDEKENYKLNIPNIKGRKMYWHNYKLKDESNLDTIATDKLTNRNVTIRPLNTKYPNGEDIEFNFRVYFEDISKNQLDKLINILNLGNDENEQDDKKKRLHKIGMGKPLGLGSVEIKVDDVKIRKISMDKDRKTIKYELKPYFKEPNFEEVFDNKDNQIVIEEFMKITTFYIDEFYKDNIKISYPVAIDGKARTNKRAGYQWFVGNATLNKKYKLPKITEDVKLPELKK